MGTNDVPSFSCLKSESDNYLTRITKLKKLYKSLKKTNDANNLLHLSF